MADPGADAARAIEAGELVVYPTETVYGLGADASDPEAVGAVFDAKHRDRRKPISMAVHDVDVADRWVRLGERERAFVETFLPGPVTIVCEGRSRVPDALTGGEDRVGLRIPDCEVALALLEAVDCPVTATSANVSGKQSARTVRELDDRILSAATVVVDGGETPGGASTVVDVDRGVIHREGLLADAVADWLGR